MIFQQFNLVPRMDVASNVLHGILNRRSTFRPCSTSGRADILRALEILDRLGIASRPRNGPRRCRGASSSASPSPAP
jgi:phosphonate transport system ATP-binding protein